MDQNSHIKNVDMTFLGTSDEIIDNVTTIDAVLISCTRPRSEASNSHVSG
jgi:hypothetical protein